MTTKELYKGGIEASFGGKGCADLRHLQIELLIQGAVINENYVASEDAAFELSDLLDKAKVIIHKDIAQQSPTVRENIKQQRAALLACIPVYYHFEETANRYWGTGSVLTYTSPWYRVLCPIGYITIGWRKRVIEVNLSESIFDAADTMAIMKQKISNTIGQNFFHANDYQEARGCLEYLFAIGQQRLQESEQLS